MSQLIYIDANVYLDFLLGRKDKLRPLSDFAFELLRKAIECRYRILVSDFVIDELQNHTQEDKIKDLLKTIKRKVVLISRDDADVNEAKRISKTNCWDALHYVLAKKGGAEIIVTRNIKDFEFSELQIKLPENL